MPKNIDDLTNSRNSLKTILLPPFRKTPAKRHTKSKSKNNIEITPISQSQRESIWRKALIKPKFYFIIKSNIFFDISRIYTIKLSYYAFGAVSANCTILLEGGKNFCFLLLYFKLARNFFVYLDIDFCWLESQLCKTSLKSCHCTKK